MTALSPTTTFSSGRPVAILALAGADNPASENEDASLWLRFTSRLRAEVGAFVYGSWLARMEIEEISNHVAIISVPTKFLKSWIDTHYLGKITAILSAEAGDAVKVVVTIRTSARGVFKPALALPVAEIAPPPVKAPAPEMAPKADGFDHGSPLDRRFTLETFLPGDSNRLAYTAVQQILSQFVDDMPVFNPLYVHGIAGVGKTHLLHAIAHDLSATRRTGHYFTAEKFMYGFALPIKSSSFSAFKDRIRDIDVLLIDDIQFLQGKSIQREFELTIDSMISMGRQVIIAADRPPADLEALEERVRSRLAGGLCVEMGALDEALRIKMLETRIAVARRINPGFHVPPAVIAYVASLIQFNGRYLDGAVNRLAATASLTQAPLTVETAQMAIRDLVQGHEPRRIKIEEIQKLVSSHYNVSRNDLLSSRRTLNVVRPRQIAMYLSKVLTLRSLPEIGRRFGGRDHTTVLHAVRKIEALTSTDPVLNDELKTLIAMLEGAR